jgi:replicative DNA helicase
MTSPLKNPYGSQFQKHVVACFVRLPEFYARFRGLLTEDVISDPDLAKIVATTHKICQDTGGQLPTKASLYEACPKSKQLIRELMTDDLRDRDYVAKKVGSFCQYKAVVAAVIDAGRKVKESAEKDEIDPSIIGAMQEAMRVGADVNDVGEFLVGRDMESRIADYKYPEQVVRVPTGLTHLDQCMGGGLQPGELGIVIGASKMGKSVLLSAIAHGSANLLNQHKVIYYSLEMKQRKVLKRMDMRIASMGSDIIKSDPDKFTDALKRRMPQLMGMGNILVKSYPTRTCTASMITSHLSQSIASGFKPSLVIVDYCDIMKPERRLGEDRHEQAGCVEDLRRIAGEFNVAVWTAAQTNRGAALKARPEIEDIGSSYEKVQIADAIISIVRTQEEKEQNLSRVYVNALRDEECGMIIKMHDDRKRMFMKTLEIVTESVKEKKEGSYGKSESEMDERRLNKSRKLMESVKANRRKEAPIQS